MVSYGCLRFVAFLRSRRAGELSRPLGRDAEVSPKLDGNSEQAMADRASAIENCSAQCRPIDSQFRGPFACRACRSARNPRPQWPSRRASCRRALCRRPSVPHFVRARKTLIPSKPIQMITPAVANGTENACPLIACPNNIPPAATLEASANLSISRARCRSLNRSIVKSWNSSGVDELNGKRGSCRLLSC